MHATATLRITHALPGRLRLRLRPASLLSTAASACADIAGILDTRSNPACACLVVRYDPAKTAQDAVLAAVRAALPAP
ncbi:hypothetical protein, partial [Desulfolutivibrio sp.]|uniref:hypothetical protein n=1 Tax=Desulfolutivibrio sp. TaxID=2773296 RepID=UPI002F96B2F7